MRSYGRRPARAWQEKDGVRRSADPRRERDHRRPHTPAALDEAFTPVAARRLVERLAWHSTPPHGSGRNGAAIARSVRAWPCLDRRRPDRAALRRAVAAWERDRNAAAVRVDGQLPTADARVKRKSLYPIPEQVESAGAEH